MNVPCHAHCSLLRQLSRCPALQLSSYQKSKCRRYPWPAEPKINAGALPHSALPLKPAWNYLCTCCMDSYHRPEHLYQKSVCANSDSTRNPYGQMVKKTKGYAELKYVNPNVLTKTLEGNNDMGMTLALLPALFAPVFNCDGLVCFHHIRNLKLWIDLFQK